MPAVKLQSGHEIFRVALQVRVADGQEGAFGGFETGLDAVAIADVLWNPHARGKIIFRTLQGAFQDLRRIIRRAVIDQNQFKADSGRERSVAGKNL